MALSKILRFYLKFLLSLGLILPNTVLAKNNVEVKFRSFNPQDVNRLNQISNSHQLARSYLKTRGTHPVLILEAKKILEQKPFKISELKLKGNLLVFKYNSVDYVIEFIKNGKYKIGSNTVDFSEKDLGASKIKFKTSKNMMNYFIPEAHAVIPVIVGTLER